VAANRYRASVLDQLDAFGIEPGPESDPAMVRAHLNELYTFELRKLRRELVDREAREGRKLRREFSERVLELRRRYALLSQPVESWTAESEPARGLVTGPAR
jgi:hypothetical protein